MAYRFDGGDIDFLASAAGSAALADAARAPLTEGSLLTDLTGLRRRHGPRASAAVETVRLRRRARRMWRPRDAALADALWATEEALQQAAPPIVAAYRARRIAQIVADTAAPGVHDLTCSIGGDLWALAAAVPLALGSDIDPVRLAMARHNLTAAGSDAPLVRADARTRTSRRLIRYADPARRDGTGRRITSADTVPPVADLDAADPSDPVILRLPPGIDYDTLQRGGEIEIVSWRGRVREAVHWPEPWARTARRATILADDGSCELFTTDDPAESAVVPVDTYLVDPDAAVVRAHLVRRYAARYGLARIDPHLAYLTGPTAVAGVRSFQVLDTAPLALRTLRRWVDRDGAGTVEIKQRGTPVVPDRLRRQIRPRGDTRVERTLIIARIGGATRAFWCRAVGPDRSAVS